MYRNRKYVWGRGGILLPLPFEFVNIFKKYHLDDAIDLIDTNDLFIDFRHYTSILKIS